MGASVPLAACKPFQFTRSAHRPWLKATAVATNGHGNGAALPEGKAVTDIFGATTVPGPEMNISAAFAIPVSEPEPISPEVQVLMEEQGIEDFENSGLKYLSNEGRVNTYSL